MLKIAIDFDGTLCENKFPEIGEPNERVIQQIKFLQKEGAKLILWTCRNGQILEDAVAWCLEHGLAFDAINQNLPEIQEAWGGDTRKVYADMYLDDKNVGGLALGALEEFIQFHINQ